MILTGRMLPLILLLILLQLIDLHLLLTYSQNPIRVIILMNNWLMYLANLLTHLILIRLPDLILMQGELKPTSPISSVALSLTSSIISYSNVTYISILTRYNSTLSQIRYSLVVILELNSVSEVQYKDMMIDRWWKVLIGIIDIVKSEV